MKSRWRQDFLHTSRPAQVPTQPRVQWVPGLFPRMRRLGLGANHPPSSITEFKERVELYRNSRALPLLPLCAFMGGYRANFAFFSVVKKLETCKLGSLRKREHCFEQTTGSVSCLGSPRYGTRPEEQLSS